MYTMQQKHESWFGPWFRCSGVKAPLRLTTVSTVCDVFQVNIGSKLELKGIV